MRKRRGQKRKLSDAQKIARGALKRYKGKQFEHRYVFAEISDALLAKLELGEKLARAKQIEAHSTRLLQAMANVERGLSIQIRTARKIIEKAVQEIPVFVERNRTELSQMQLGDLNALQKNLQVDLRRLKGAKDSLPTTLSPSFLETTRAIHMDGLKHLIGEEKFNSYTEQMREAFGELTRNKS